jgi:hypothetical protein
MAVKTHTKWCCLQEPDTVHCGRCLICRTLAWKKDSGGVVRFDSKTSCNFAFVSGKQPVITKSAGEAELIAQNKVGDLIEPARQLLEELGFEQEKVRR